MNKIITMVGKYSILTKSDPYLALIQSIIYQQLGGKAAQSIYRRFVTHYRNFYPSPERVIITNDETLRSFGLSKKKIEYVQVLSKGIINGSIKVDTEVLSKMHDIEIIDYLTKIKGIGRWTAEMFLIFCLGRLDVFPVKDLGIKKAVQMWYFPESKVYPLEEKMLEISNLWKPYRSIATWYLWKSFANFDSIG